MQCNILVIDKAVSKSQLSTYAFVVVLLPIYSKSLGSFSGLSLVFFIHVQS